LQSGRRARFASTIGLLARIISLLTDESVKEAGPRAGRQSRRTAPGTGKELSSP
jgi:hypothetical protein